MPWLKMSASGTCIRERLDATPVYLHLDVDVIDSEQLSGLRFPSGPGPSLTQIDECLAAVCAAADVIGADLA
jgi:arginase